MKKLLALIASIVLLGGLVVMAWWILVNPGNPLTMLFRGQISEVSGKVVTGPYPQENDFRSLRNGGVSTVISLLDPRIPYESILLERERALAARHGMRHLNFPMASIFGRRFDEDTYRDETEKAAAAAGAPENGKVYLHCYLGIHRLEVVLERLRASGVASGTYTLNKSERDAYARLLDKAQDDYDRGDFQAVLEGLGKAPSLDPPGKMLRAWSLFRQNRIPEARAAFEEVLQAEPALLDARSGLGFCFLQEGNLEGAEREFSIVLKKQGEDPQALEGMGIVHFRRGRKKEAAACLEKVVKKYPENMEAAEILEKLRQKASPMP